MPSDNGKLAGGISGENGPSCLEPERTPVIDRCRERTPDSPVRFATRGVREMRDFAKVCAERQEVTKGRDCVAGTQSFELLVGFRSSATVVLLPGTTL